MYILVSGAASVSVSMESEARKRIATFSPGMMFGDMAILDRLPRSADVTADSEMKVLALSAEQFDSLASLPPRLQMLPVAKSSLALARRVREANIGLLNF
jgi:CRP-like cAMP-binding protein